MALITSDLCALQYKHSAIEAFLQQRGADTSPNSLREGRDSRRRNWHSAAPPLSLQ